MKPTAEERAKVAAGWCEAMCSGELRPCSKCVAIALGEAYADGRRAGLEEAAAVVCAWCARRVAHPPNLHAGCVGIRALAEAP